MSPDGKYVVVVTSRGIIESNKIQSTIWLFRTASIRRAIEGDSTSPKPEALATWSVIPTLTTFEGYQSVISSVRWTPDSQTLYFLRQEAMGTHGLCSVQIKSRTIQVLSGRKQDVERFSLANGVLVYSAVKLEPIPQNARRYTGVEINRDAFDATGRRISDIVFPLANQGSPLQKHELWVSKGQGIRRVSDGSSFSQLDQVHYWDSLSISPNGRYVVQLRAVTSVSPSWTNYTPLAGFEDWLIHFTRSDPHDAYYPHEYVLEDLNTGQTTPLIDAPYASSLAYFDIAHAAWSADSRRVLVTGTFLPFSETDADEKARRSRPCAVASVDLPSRTAHCIVFNREEQVSRDGLSNSLRLERVAFGKTPSDVNLQLRWHRGKGGVQNENYRFELDKWILETVDSNSENDDGHGQKGKLSIEIRQDVNSPPALWATNAATGRVRKIWDPNPQLANIRLGEARIYHWKDSTGYEWTGGLILPVGYMRDHRYPLVIQTHGFWSTEFLTDGSFPTAMSARPLASVGIIALQMTVNGTHLLGPQEAEDNVRGFESAIDSLVADGYVDPTKVGIVGFSRTCWYVESALVKDPSLFAAASIADGMDHGYMQSMLFDLDNSTSEIQKLYGSKPFGKGLERWLSQSPPFSLDRVQTPVMITAIGPGSILAEWELYSSLHQQEKPVDLLYLPSGQHILQKPLDRLASQQRTVDWFRYWLQGYERSRPEEEEQYKRWALLRQSGGVGK